MARRNLKQIKVIILQQFSQRYEHKKKKRFFPDSVLQMHHEMKLQDFVQFICLVEHAWNSFLWKDLINTTCYIKYMWWPFPFLDIFLPMILLIVYFCNYGCFSLSVSIFGKIKLWFFSAKISFPMHFQYDQYMFEIFWWNIKIQQWTFLFCWIKPPFFC